MAGTVTSSRMTDQGFYYSYRNANSSGLLRDGIFDPSKVYSNSWKPAVQQTTSFRSGKSFLKALSDPEQIVQDEDLRDRDLPDNSDLLMLREKNQALADSTYDHGHPFSTVKIERSFSTVNLRSSNGQVSYYGPACVFNGSGALLASPFDGSVTNGKPSIQPGASPTVDLSYGAKAISKTIPTLPVAGIAAFLGELHEGLPRRIGHSTLFSEQADVFRGIGDEYLNVVFGWKPFVSDIKKFAYAFSNAGKLLAQYRKDSGKTVRRKYAFPPLHDTASFPAYTIGFGGSDVRPSSCIKIPIDNSAISTFSSPEIDSLVTFGSTASVHQSAVVKQRYWFSGAYTYLVSEDDSFLGRMESYVQQANKLLGIKLTPDVLWELTPWSWLSDWEVNIGVNISNMTALGQDNLALRYGYLMHESVFRHYVSTSPVTSYSGWSGPIRSTYRFTTKERVRSTPFGFGSNPASFTERQWAILGALGLTKAPKVLF